MEIKDLYGLYKKYGIPATDSRNVANGSMFFALKGDKFDGNDYALKALDSGAKYAVVDRPSLFSESALCSAGINSTNNSDSVIVDLDSAEVLLCEGGLILVNDVLSVMQALARFHRSRYNIPVLAVTGTNGKTTTKELISAVLSVKYNVVYTKGNLNNHIGVPLTLFGISEDTEIAVIEMGASAPGEIATLASIAMPTYGIITNVGRAHLLGFGSFEGVKKTKGELFDYLQRTDNLVFYNEDNEDIKRMVESRSGLRKKPYGVSFQGASVLPVTVKEPYLRMTVPGIDGIIRSVNTNLIGTYNSENVLAALSVGRYFAIEPEKAIRAVEEYIPSNNRSQLVRSGDNLLIIDAYNANPTSMKAALDNFAATEFPCKTLVLGDMLELGGYSTEAHREVLTLAKHIVGKEFKDDAGGGIFLVGKSEFKTAIDPNEAEGIMLFETSVELREYFINHPPHGRSILIKGSNATRLTDLILAEKTPF